MSSSCRTRDGGFVALAGVAGELLTIHCTKRSSGFAAAGRRASCRCRRARFRSSLRSSTRLACRRPARSRARVRRHCRARVLDDRARSTSATFRLGRRRIRPSGRPLRGRCRRFAETFPAGARSLTISFGASCQSAARSAGVLERRAVANWIGRVLAQPVESSLQDVMTVIPGDKQFQAEFAQGRSCRPCRQQASRVGAHQPRRRQTLGRGVQRAGGFDGGSPKISEKFRRWSKTQRGQRRRGRRVVPGKGNMSASRAPRGKTVAYSSRRRRSLPGMVAGAWRRSRQRERQVKRPRRPWPAPAADTGIVGFEPHEIGDFGLWPLRRSRTGCCSCRRRRPSIAQKGIVGCERRRPRDDIRPLRA